MVRKLGGLLAIAGLGVVLVMATLEAQGSDKGLVGTWKVNIGKSSFSPGPPPKSMSVTYSTVGADGLKVVVDVAPADGAAQHWEMMPRYDGKEHPIKGNPNADTVSIKRIDDLTTESTFKKAAKVTATNTRVLSKDGKTLTVTSVGTTIDGKPRKDVQVLEK